MSLLPSSKRSNIIESTKSYEVIITTDYVANKIYENGVLKKILTDNGYIEGGIYYFYVKDHLGNNRIVANQGARVIQSNQYYPFGMLFAESTSQDKQSFKYNGKELDQMHGLNQYDYSARYYDPAISRFTTVDPLAEKYYSISPYVYVANNPMKFIDPTGMWYGEFEMLDGQWSKISDIGDNIGVDFFHTGLKTDKGRELTLIQDKEGNFAKMFGARDLLKGGEVRGNDVDWSTVTSEYLSGTGPGNSIFEGHHPSNLAIQGQLKYAAAKANFEESGKSSQFTPINWGLLDVVLTPDMQAQMMGSYGASFYKLGGNIFYL